MNDSLSPAHGADPAPGEAHAPASLGDDAPTVDAGELLHATAVAVYALDRRGHCTFANPACVRTLGYTHAHELLGRNMHALIHHTHPGGAPYPGQRCRIYRAFRRGRDIHVEDEVLWRADGSSFAAECWAYPIIRDAQVTGCVVTFLDVTDQRRVAERRRQSEAQYRDLIEGSSQGIMIVRDWRLLFANTAFARMLGYDSDDELLRLQFTLDSLFPVHERIRLRRYHETRFSGDAAPARYECRALRRNGAEITLENTERLISWEGAPAIQISVIDIGRYKRVQEELERAKKLAESASRAKSDFLASMSHEIRTLMTTMIGMTDLLAETPLNGEQRRWLHSFNSAGDQLLALVNDVIDLSKIESAEMELERLSFGLRDLIHDVIAVLDPGAADKGLSLQCAIASDVEDRLVGDAHRLRQILVNLVTNATKFTPQGSIEVRVRKDRRRAQPGKLLFAVTDTGIGIGEAQRKEIFSLYRQADPTIKHEYGGSGLGLAICRQLVEAMGGRIWVASEVGKGSTFYFTVPFSVAPELSRAASAAAPKATAASPHETARSSMKVLLVDDRSEIRDLVGAFLRETPYRLELAENGALGFEKFVSGNFDLVLMDNQMPVMDGCAATRRIRAWETSHQRTPTPILALTAGVLKEEIQQSLDAGCDGHMGKPIRKNVLLRVLDDYSSKNTGL